MLKHYVKLFEMGSSHIQPAWESNNNNKKKWRAGGRGQRHCCSGFSPPEPLVWGARRGREGGWCGAGRGPPAQWAQFPAGVGRPRRFLRGEASAGGRGWGWGGGDTGGRAGGLRSRRRLLRYLCGPRPGSGPPAGCGGAFLGSPRTRPPPLSGV